MIDRKFKRQTKALACDGCTLCCQGHAGLGDAIMLQPQDDPKQYHTQVIQGRLMLKWKPDGDCFYLGKNGCTIYERRPLRCRQLDCRDLLKLPTGILGDNINSKVMDRARQLERETRGTNHG